ncbi:D-alanyl-D-alanine carboxypeptidase/D-alanyl-D-alanine endopeptidase [Bacteroides caecigallinarum]|uniref:D-alanyl-D-alanine carboxypeptidase/D-alanyl-D-alanine endopeptidase n=1 Tax=Bacteroides caecigallinarum TaxID=1411144 RepID=UPI001F32CF4D|nr:D-alanyl-D-alanine carboxypeptidase/D-alanyl-D-alanine-endopeptidase [Bacteroides caecigallinarum]MCF2581572.1 D-alanyl-D-alanine carboxypeptidase/D-alanyl-D-alanine-endopeptidase [Bacteroides caecigallinarum]
MTKTIFKTFSLFTLLLFCVSSYSQTVSDRIDSLINNSSFLNTSEVGILVYDLTSKKELYRYQAEKLYRPASVEKVITSVTALSVLGKDYQIKTGLSYSGYIEGDTLYGDIYVKGDFDPEFMQEDMESMVEAISNMGIHGVKGRLIGDVSMMDSVYWGPGWAWDDTPDTFQPYLSPLMLNRGCVNISISPSGGSKADVEIKPESDFYTIDNRTSPAGTYVSATRNWLNNGNVISISGSSKHKASTSMNIFDTKAFFMNTLRYQLQGKGIFISRDSITYNNVPGNTKGIITVYRDIDDVLKRALKESDNLSAEALFFHATREICNGKKNLSHKDGQNAIYKFMKSDIGFDSRKFRIVDGCGVSDYNYVSPELIMEYLKYAFSSPFIFHPFYDSLPIAGIDGTLQYRMSKGKCFRNVRAKTGTLTGVCSLAGYVTSSTKHTIAFVIINQNVLKYVSARRFQDEICNILSTYN